MSDNQEIARLQERVQTNKERVRKLEERLFGNGREGLYESVLLIQGSLSQILQEFIEIKAMIKSTDEMVQEHIRDEEKHSIIAKIGTRGIITMIVFAFINILILLSHIQDLESLMELIGMIP